MGWTSGFLETKETWSAGAFEMTCSSVNGRPDEIIQLRLWAWNESDSLSHVMRKLLFGDLRRVKTEIPARVLIFIPRHTKNGRVLCYTLQTFECPSGIHLSVSASFPCSNFSTFWPICFKLCIDIGIGKAWYGIASGLISFWNYRVVALDVCQQCVVLRFRALTLVPFYRFHLFTDFLQTLHRHWYRRGLVWDCKWDNFIQKQQS